MVAVHEAGHFVFGNLMGLGAIISVKVARNGGDVVRKQTPIDGLIRMEQRGVPLEKMIMPGPSFSNDAAAYREARDCHINKVIILALAGCAAEAELAGGSAVLTELDLELTRKFALMLVSESAFDDFIAIRFAEVRQLCTGKVRSQILAVAKRLEAKRELNAQEAATLWAEVSRN